MAIRNPRKTAQSNGGHRTEAGDMILPPNAAGIEPFFYRIASDTLQIWGSPRVDDDRNGPARQS